MLGPAPDPELLAPCKPPALAWSQHSPAQVRGSRNGVSRDDSLSMRPAPLKNKGPLLSVLQVL